MAIRKSSSLPTGSWSGKIHQAVGPEGKPVTIPADLTISPSGKITGRFHLREKRKATEHLAVTGTCTPIHPRYVKLDYRVPLDGVPQLGASVMKISRDGRSLKGPLRGLWGRARRRWCMGW